jgi:hypothetical protein
VFVTHPLGRVARGRKQCRDGFGEGQGIPAIFAMLSADAMRTHVFLQGADPRDACVRCVLSNMCAAFATFFVHRALMGWPEGIEPFNWSEADLMGIAPDRTGVVQRRSDCPTCAMS